MLKLMTMMSPLPPPQKQGGKYSELNVNKTSPSTTTSHMPKLMTMMRRGQTATSRMREVNAVWRGRAMANRMRVDETPPDWGEDDDSPAHDHASAEPEEERRPSHNLGTRRPRTPSRSPQRPNPNMGGGERPRTPSRSPQRPNPNMGGERPRTPSRSPRRAVLRPGPMWRDIRRVQDHMRTSHDNQAARERRTVFAAGGSQKKGECFAHVSLYRCSSVGLNGLHNIAHPEAQIQSQCRGTCTMHTSVTMGDPRLGEPL